MSITAITIDVYCTLADNAPAYRLFVDDELLTERSWIWPSYEVFIKENITVDIDEGQHNIKLIGKNGKFTFKNITVNNRAIDNRTWQEFTFNC
jgi:hypothetical protein